MKVEILKQTSYKGVVRTKGSVHDILDEIGGGDSTALRWIERGIAKASPDVNGAPRKFVDTAESDTMMGIPGKKTKVEK